MINSWKLPLVNNTLVRTLSGHPYEPTICQPVSILSWLYLLPAALQCALLYPYFERFRWIRWIRAAMIPIGAYCSLKFPLDYCFQPTSRRGYPNLALTCCGFTMASKSIEWGLLRTCRQGKISKRPGFEPELPDRSTKPSERSKDSHDEDPAPSGSRSDPTSPPADPSFSMADWLGWSLELLSSPRGAQYDWGIKVSPNTASAIDVVKRLYQHNVVHVLATGFSILSRDLGSPSDALRYLGLPHFYGLNFFAESLATLAFGFYLVTMTELVFGYLTLLVHFINFLQRSNCIKLPSWLMRSLNLKLHTPLYNQPHRSTSLAQLWGKAWHQNFRQSFLILGAFPAFQIAKTLGLRPKLQRLAGLFGSFLVSGLLHEFAIYCIARKPHTRPYVPFQEFPSSLLYFMLQPIGILVEPCLIPLIPGGGTVWCYLFTLLSALPFRRQYFDGHRLLDLSYPPVSWNWFMTSLLIPGLM